MDTTASQLACFEFEFEFPQKSLILELRQEVCGIFKGQLSCTGLIRLDLKLCAASFVKKGKEKLVGCGWLCIHKNKCNI